MPPHSAKVLKPCLIFSNFKGDSCQKSLDRNFNQIKVKEWKLKISYFFVISRGLVGCLRFYVPLKNISLIWRRHLIAGEGLQNLGLCSALRAFEQGGIFIVPHLL
jgi:hypothetical protein